MTESTHRSRSRAACIAVFAVFLVLALPACHRGVRGDASTTPVATPPTFDVTLTAAKDDQFDVNDVPLTAEELTDHLRYRQEQGQGVKTALLVRGEKQKISKAHIVRFVRVAHSLGFTPYMKDGDEFVELQATGGGSDAEAEES
ncbi:MAG: hypothetical protein ABI451_10295, partial [Dokdonella sp.]